MNFLIVFFLIFNFLTWLHYAYFVSRELCETLNINVFTIKDKQLQETQEVQVQIE